MIKTQVKLLCSDKELVPQYETDGAAGFDFKSAIDIQIQPGETCKVPTGIRVELPKDFEIQVRPRSGMSLKTKLRVSNSPGTIDSKLYL